MEAEQEETIAENNIFCISQNSLPEIQTSRSSESGHVSTTSSQVLDLRDSPLDSVHLDTSRTSFIVATAYCQSHKNGCEHLSVDSCKTASKQDGTSQNLEVFDLYHSEHRPDKNSVLAVEVLSSGHHTTDCGRKKSTGSTSRGQTPTPGHEIKQCGFRIDARLSSDVETGIEQEAAQGTQYLLPETSGFVSTLQGVTRELKRGRGRPRKEGLLLRTNRSSDLDKNTSRHLSSRGHKKVGRPVVRGCRGGRRGRPPYLHVGLACVASSPSSEGDFSNPLLSPADFAQAASATKPDILLPRGMADFSRQSSVTSTSGASDAPGGVSASPGYMAHSSSMPGTPTDVSPTPESQNSGHLCALCNCGERSLLGQGDILRFEPSEGFDVFKLLEPKTLREADEVDTLGKSKGPPPPTWRRSRGPLKTGRERSRSPRQSGEKESSGCPVSDELSLVGFSDDTEISQLFESSGHVWVHHCCALWSEEVTMGESNQLTLVDKAVYSGMSQRCAHCRKFGATVACCIPECGKRFHFPCASAGGCFQDMKTLSLLCAEHIDQAEAVAGNAACCIQCGLVGNLKEQLFCTSCGHHYHGNCLCPPVDMKPIVRAGWQCPNCKICQTCRTAGEDSKMLVCDKCDKGYHTFCLKPVMTTIPKNGWKCKNCRICTDCGSRTPGSGPSSRWHLNYSVCDSCYQQRNKGLCCPLCGKAYRHFHNKTMLPCGLCKKYVHIECDQSINPNRGDKLKDLPQDYICTVCRETDPDAMMDLDQQLPALSYAASEESVESFM
ncbi:unnamed protein product, partial [Candidula unifasciata]